MERQRQTVLYLKDVVKLSFRQIAKQTGLSRKRVSKIYQGCCVVERKGASKLDKHIPMIAGWYKEYAHLRADQVYQWLKERGIDVSYTLVVKHTRTFRRRIEKVYHQLYFHPAEEAQVDWAVINHPVLGKVYCFAFVLSYSRYLFAHIFPRGSFEFFIEGHLMAFAALDGHPRGHRYDNLKTVVLRRKPEVQYNERFLEFCRHYGFEIRLCNPGAGNEKGRIERAIRSIKEGVLSLPDNCQSFETLNMKLHAWVDNKNRTVHRSTGKSPVELLSTEPLMPLPAIPWRNVTIHPPVKTTKTGMIIFETNSYSAPEYLVGKALSVHSTPTQIKLYDKDKEVASHPRAFERSKQLLNPLHRSYGKISEKAKLQRIYEVIRNMSPCMEDFLRNNEVCGEDPQKTAYAIFKLLKSHSRGMLLSITAECLKRKSPRLKTFMSCLYGTSPEEPEPVHPQNSELMGIDYTPRGLEEYDDE